MQSVPTTPKRADDGIEALKRSLSTKWRIQFPRRDSTWSPSHRNPDLPEEQISTRIQFLYYKGGALDLALKQFEKNAITIFSKWVHKPRADADVLPARTPSTSTLQNDFLRKRNALPPSAVKEITESLLQQLMLVADRVKAGESIPRLDGHDSRRFSAYEATAKKSASSLDEVRPSVEEYPSIKSRKAPLQTTLSQFFRNKSAPGAAASPATTATQASSDDFPDADMVDVMAETNLMDLHEAPVLDTVDNGDRSASGHTSPGEETFETPPTTPSRLRNTAIGLGITKPAHNALPISEDPFAQPRQSSRDVTVHRPQFEPPTSKKRPCPEPERMKPPPTRRVSREKQAQQQYLPFAVPTPPPDSHSFMTRSMSSSRSFDNMSSVSSSFTSHSPAWTSPNTSFHSDLATSFDSASEDTDTTVRPSLGQLPSRAHYEPSLSWSRFDYSGLSPFTVKPESSIEIASCADSMDVDDGSTITYNNQFITKPDIGKRESRLSLAEPNPVNKDIAPEWQGPDGTTLEAFDTRTTNHEHAAPALTTNKKSLQSMDDLRSRLAKDTPFASLPTGYEETPLRQLYEVVRVSTACKVPITGFASCLSQSYENYDQLWSRLKHIVSESAGRPLPERSSLMAWKRAGEGFERVALAAKIKFLDSKNGPVFEATWSSLKLEPSYRFARQFGHDRFCVLGFPSLDSDKLPEYLKSDPVAARDTINNWLAETEHQFLGRTWRAFWVKPEPTKKGKRALKSLPGDIKFRVYLFAIDGHGFRSNMPMGEIDTRRQSHKVISIEDFINWFMLFEVNKGQPLLKLFSRLGLGLSSTTATFEFNPKEIIRCNDAYADSPGERRLDFGCSDGIKAGHNLSESKSPVMNDGCARISRDAAIAIANMIGMDQAPSVFQGRIGGAKGMWIIDALDERPNRLTRKDGKVYWIEISSSQLKFNPHPIDILAPDKARVTFEVNKYSKKLSPSALNFQLMPILENRGVPQDVFVALLRADLSAKVGEMEVAMDDSLALRKWNQENNPVASERATYGGIEMMAGLPDSTAEKINWFVEHGFEPKTCRYLKDQLWKAIKAYCLRLENRMHIGLGQSTSAFMIADPLAILEQDEVHFGFSAMFRDSKSGFDENMLHGIDVLVARSPAHLPSDIQKVRAVFKPELRIYRDVIVFPSKGAVSLASKLSGGDYDGDRAWVCWDPHIVNPFQNAPVPVQPSLESYGIEKDSTKVSDIIDYPDRITRFLRHAFNFNLQTNMLGSCSTFHEAYCYHEDKIDSPPAINIAILLGNLVDSAKGGFKFDEPKWIAYLKQIGLNKKLDKPAFKERLKAKPKRGNLIDHLVFHVAKEEREKLLSKFTEHFKDVESWDEDLVRIRRDEYEAAKKDEQLQNVLGNLKFDLDKIMDYWRMHARRDEDQEEFLPTSRATSLSFPAVAQTCRSDFLAIEPRWKKDENTLTMTGVSPTKNLRSNNQRRSAESSDTLRSDTILRWQRIHPAFEATHWDLLKASVAFYHYHRTNFVWFMAGTELGKIKLMAGGPDSYRMVTNRLFNVYKADSKAIEGIRKREEGRVDVEEEEEEDEFGDPDLDADLGML